MCDVGDNDGAISAAESSSSDGFYDGGSASDCSLSDSSSTDYESSYDSRDRSSIDYASDNGVEDDSSMDYASDSGTEDDSSMDYASDSGTEDDSSMDYASSNGVEDNSSMDYASGEKAETISAADSALLSNNDNGRPKNHILDLEPTNSLLKNVEEESDKKDGLSEKGGTDDEKPDEATQAEIDEKSEFSSEINDSIRSSDELEIYQKADLKEAEIDGRKCLIRDIDLDYIDEKTGKTNRELMALGRAPYDAKTGEKIELHHIGQKYDSPLAELTADTEHGGENYSILHTTKTDSWRNNSILNNHYNSVQRPNHWIHRV